MATDELVKTTGIAHHGAGRLPSVDVDSFNIELKDGDGFLGDRASKGAFREILDRWRQALAHSGADPFGETPTWNLTKSQLDKYLEGDDPASAALIHSAVEDFAGELTLVVSRFLRLPEWKST